MDGGRYEEKYTHAFQLLAEMEFDEYLGPVLSHIWPPAQQQVANGQWCSVHMDTTVKVDVR